MITHDKLFVESWYAIEHIESLRIKACPHKHVTLELGVVVSTEKGFSAILQAKRGDPIRVYGVENGKERTLFAGRMCDMCQSGRSNVFQLEISAVAATHDMDTQKKRRSFQKIDMTYYELFEEVMKGYPRNNLISSIADDRKIPAPIIQYDETDWGFLDRMASHFNSVLYSDAGQPYPRVCVGFPKGKAQHVLNPIRYSAFKDVHAFRIAMANGKDPSRSGTYKRSSGTTVSAKAGSGIKTLGASASSTNDNSIKVGDFKKAGSAISVTGSGQISETAACKQHSVLSKDVGDKQQPGTIIDNLSNATPTKSIGGNIQAEAPRLDEPDIDDMDFFYYRVETDELYEIGDEVLIFGQKLYVSEKEIELERGSLICRYKIAQRGNVYTPYAFNPLAMGLQLEGRVLDTIGETVKVHLNIDAVQDKETAYWFPFAPPTGSLMYCMPQHGTNVVVYIPDKNEEDSTVLGCVRKNSETCFKIEKPDTRYFGTEYGSELMMDPTSLHLMGAWVYGTPALELDDDLGVNIISSKETQILAFGNIYFVGNKNILLSAKNLIALLSSKQGVILEENDITILGERVRFNGKTKKAEALIDEELLGTSNIIKKITS